MAAVAVGGRLAGAADSSERAGPDCCRLHSLGAPVAKQIGAGQM